MTAPRTLDELMQPETWAPPTYTFKHFLQQHWFFLIGGHRVSHLLLGGIPLADRFDRNCVDWRQCSVFVFVVLPSAL